MYDILNLKSVLEIIYVSLKKFNMHTKQKKIIRKQ